MKESGINYFLNNLEILPPSVFYTFEDGAGSKISSVSSGNSMFSGQLSSVGSFWSIPGSGFLHGNNVTISNGTGLNSTTFTHIISYEKTSTGSSILFDTSNYSKSGYVIGLTDSNKLYFQTYNNNINQPIVSANYNNLGTKNLIFLSYTTNYVEMGYYNYNSQQFETESFNNNYSLVPSNFATLGSLYTGYLDYYLYFNNFYGLNVLNELASGFYNTPTGLGYIINTITSTGITGYQSINYVQTGITGYATSPATFDGVGDFTGLFPLTSAVVNLTGIIQSGLVLSGVVGIKTINITGGLIELFYTNTGYVQSFGMDDVNFRNTTCSTDIIKLSTSLIPFDNNYNFTLSPVHSGYNISNVAPINITTNNICLYDNGLSQYISGWYISNNLLFINGSNLTDNVFFDIGSPGNTGNLISFTGQQIFLNGLNLISGRDFITTAGIISLINNNPTGIIFEYPIISTSITGNNNIKYAGNRFSRNSSLIYVNGLRQLNEYDYVEGSSFDILIKNNYNQSNNDIIYDDDNLFWDM